MSFLDVQYQGHAQRTIQRALSSERLSHAYIFHGPDGVGKETFARGLAETLLCARPIDKTLTDGDVERVGSKSVRQGCGNCQDCRAVSGEAHPDLHLIYRQLNRLHPDAAVRARKAHDLGVDVIRHFVIDKVHLTPQRGLKKVFIIREADRITTQAQNALLKTLEEPPIDTVLILCSAAVDSLLPTTRSRCQLVRFDVLPTRFIYAKLRAAHPDLNPQQADWYARSGGGSLGASLQFAAAGLFESYQTVALSLSALAPGTEAGAVELWNTTVKDLAGAFSERDPDITDAEANRRGLKRLFQLIARFYADALHGISGSAIALSSPDSLSPREVPAHLTPSGICRAISRIAEAERQADLNANAQLVIETLCTDLAAIASPTVSTR